MTAKVKLCAIAKNEGPYLADWVFHHLHFGFDAIEIWVNGTKDASGRIIAAISAAHPQVTKRNADRLLERCLAEGRHFQHEAYALQAREARRGGFTHVAFLDLDEYWTPLDLQSPIQDFLPDEAEINVVSFPWCLDLPDAARRPFESPLTPPVALQVDQHVKSVGRLNGSIRKPLTHTFKTRGGARLLVREPFPITDARAQLFGSLMSFDDWAGRWDRLPEAFILHAINRSEQEYLANLTQGQRQAGGDSEFKTNRHGYLPGASPVLTFRPRASARRAYRRQRKKFHHGLELDQLITRSQRLLLAREAGLADRLERDADLRRQLAVALRGTRFATD